MHANCCNAMHLLKDLLVKSAFLAAALGAIATSTSHSPDAFLFEHINVDDVAMATIREHAAVVGSEIDLELKDHYGNPDQFIQYIIRIPPVHA